jgi:hypothetical protein
LTLRFTSDNITLAEFKKLYSELATMSAADDMTRAIFDLDEYAMNGYNIVDKDEDLSYTHILVCVLSCD